MISDASLISWANFDYLETEQVEVSSASMGILNIECAVFPNGNNSAAIPEDATKSTIKLFDIKYVMIAFQRYVFSVPPLHRQKLIWSKNSTWTRSKILGFEDYFFNPNPKASQISGSNPNQTRTQTWTFLLNANIIFLFFDFYLIYPS